MIRTTITFLLGLIVGVASAFSYFNMDRSVPISNLSAFPIYERQAYTIAYDSRFKISYWTKERLTNESLAKITDREGLNFFEDKDLYPLHRSTLEDYQGSGFDRGHVVPAADARFSKNAIQETFKLSNTCPQDPNLNRGFWARLEKHIREIALEYDYVDVITGPLFLPIQEEDGTRWVKFRVIGSNDVAVPTHLFKVV